MLGFRCQPNLQAIALYMVQLIVHIGGQSMEIVNASQARANLFSLVEEVNRDHNQTS
jgi:hypothetical protein